jgi:2-polyprenyl-3-methyl-5-hydroxy-6-metoxy-1,4-benzoquinol methylase
MSGERLDTAHEYWDQWWGEAKQRAKWSEPDPAVTSFAQTLLARSAKQVLDVGTGIGRHALYYARLGFEVFATDASATGLDEVTRSADAQGLDVDVRLGPFTELPIEDSSVDHVLAWNVLYHGDGEVVTTALAECRRVLRPNGTLQLTMLSKRHRAFGIGREIRPDTFVDEASRGDKDHPHFYVDAQGLERILGQSGFEIIELIDMDQDPPAGFHWEVLSRVSTA